MEKYVVNRIEEVQEGSTLQNFSDYELKILKQLIAEEEIYAEELDNPKFTRAIKKIKQRLLG